MKQNDALTIARRLAKKTHVRQLTAEELTDLWRLQNAGYLYVYKNQIYLTKAGK